MTRLLLCCLAFCVLALPVSAAITTEWAVGTTTTLLSTELNSLGNGSFSAASSVYDNRIGQTGNGYVFCRIELKATFAANPTAGGAILVWFLKTADGGSTYEVTPTASFGLNRLPDVVLPATTGQTFTQVSVDTRCPADRFKAVLQSSNTGQALTASGHSLKLMPLTYQGN